MKETETAYRAILARDPANGDALYGLGLIVAESGRRDEAYGLMQRALAVGAPSNDLLCAFGRIAAMLNKDNEAQSCFVRVLQADPDAVPALAGLGALFYKQGKLDDALPYLERTVALAPAHGAARSNLAGVYLRKGAFAAAEAHLRAAIAQDDDINLHNSLGVVLLVQRRLPEAEASLRAALSRAAGHGDANCNLGIVLSQGGRYAEAIPYFETTLVAQPDHQGALAGLATAFQSLNRVAEARAAFARVAQINPRSWWARWGLLVALPILYGDESEILKARQGFADDLASLEHDLPRHVASDHGTMVLAVASRTNFYLHYQGENDRDLQRRYGALVTQIAEAAFPRYAKPLAPRQLATGDRIRVGFVSACLRNHSIAKTHGAWMRDLPRDRFEVVIFHVGAVSDETTERLKTGSRYHDCARLSQGDLIERIAGENLDVLIWPDIGMEGKTQIPAALRLAPVQANGGGHPVTSGLAAMDYFLSSDLMEVAGAEAQYTETLVRLPNLASSYPPPPAATGTVPDGVRALKDAGRVLYLCSQSLYKLLPHDDAVFAEIARAVPGADILFIAHWEPAITAFFARRMAAAFAAAGVSADRLHVIPQLAQADFYALNRAADVILDSFAWSGNNSTLEALAFDRPVVTLPGTTMRARHTAAILRRLGLTETVARDRADYVAIAARLGGDRRWREALSAQIAERKQVLYDDPAPVAALATWMEQVVRRRS